jgi:SAM-dependent methyltransferase
MHVAALVPSDASTIVDLGCGDGTLARGMTSYRPDLDLRGLEIHARPSTAIPVAEFDGETLPLDDRSTDVVMMVDMLHHSEDPHRLLREAARVARRAVIVKDHLRDPWLGTPRLRLMDWAGNVGHGVALRNRYWSRDEWKEAFARLGLVETERREQLGLYPTPVRWLFETGLHFVTRLEFSDRTRATRREQTSE